ncbi:MAG: hypothetical protein VX938_05735, partial [Myxococcota bacterium]|nr:hypothetical protein [Myxococcota bacterium]
SLGALMVLASLAGSAAALELTQRQVQVSAKLDVSSAGKLSEKLLAFDAQGTATIHMMVSTTSGTAQGVLLLADTIRSLESPIVAVVTTHVRGAGAALVSFADHVLIYPSAGLVFTEVPYEGVKKYEPPKKKKKKKKKKAESDEKATEGEGEGDEPEAESPATDEDVEEEDERKPEEKFLQDRVRSDYLTTFYERVAKGLPWKGKDLQARLEKDGGVAVDADEAVRKKIAHGKVDRITYRKLPEVKTERKEVTTEKEQRTVPRP